MQSEICGMTSYDEQRLDDIVKDIETWVEVAYQRKTSMISLLDRAKNSGFWNNVDTDFQEIIEESILYFNTIISDLSLVVSDIKKSEVLNRDIKLLNRIGVSSARYNVYYPKTYNADRSWHDYNNLEFHNVEKLYITGRDYYASLQDASNAAERLQDYLSEEKREVIQNVRIEGDVSEGRLQIIANNTGQAVVVNNEKMEFKDILLEIKTHVDSDEFENELQNKRDADEIRSYVNKIIAEADKKPVASFKDMLNQICLMLDNVATGVVSAAVYDLILKCLHIVFCTQQ